MERANEEKETADKDGGEKQKNHDTEQTLTSNKLNHMGWKLSKATENEYCGTMVMGQRKFFFGFLWTLGMKNKSNLKDTRDYLTGNLETDTNW